MRTAIALLFALLAIFAVPANAQVLSETVVVEQWDPAAGRWVEVTGAERFVAARAKPPMRALANYGPFRALSDGRAALVGLTDAASPAHFAAMLQDFPLIATLELVDAGGTMDDAGNMQVGRMIRAAGLTTHVPAHGSVRSGAVELFLAGVERRIDNGAEFAVHSWLDNLGLQPNDYAADHQANRIYLDYYREMGMDAGQAQAFYAMTNSVPHHDAKWLDAGEMRGWTDTAEQHETPRLDYLTLGGDMVMSTNATYIDSQVVLP